MHPPIWTSSDSSALKHATSSPSFLLSPSPGLTHLPWTFAWSQYSKWPISSEKATLYECAAHGTRVCSLDVEYIGWNAYGDWLHVSAVGSKLTCANPLPSLAVIDPDCPLVRSFISVTRPSEESRIEMSSWSPASMNRSVVGSGTNVSPVRSSGAGGESGVPSSVMNAKFAG